MLAHLPVLSRSVHGTKRAADIFRFWEGISGLEVETSVQTLDTVAGTTRTALTYVRGISRTALRDNRGYDVQFLLFTGWYRWVDTPFMS